MYFLLTGEKNTTGTTLSYFNMFKQRIIAIGLKSDIVIKIIHMKSQNAHEYELPKTHMHIKCLFSVTR